MNGTDVNLDITYQDSQYLAELYGKLGALQQDLANFDIIAMDVKLQTALLVAALGILVGLCVCTGLVMAFEYTEFDVIGPIIGMVIYVIILIVVWYFASDITIALREHEIMRDIEATEMAIEAIKMKYGWT